MSNKAIILLRVSTTRQDIEQQRNDMSRDAKYRGYNDADLIFIEDKESAIKLSEEERNGINKMKYYIEQGNVGAVFIWEISRLSRQLPMLYSLRDYLQAHKVQLYCLKPDFKLFNDDWTISESSNIVFSLFAVMSENEMNIKKARMNRGRSEMKKKGYSIAPKIMFGYTTIKEGKRSKIVIDEKNAKIVKQMFKLAQTYTGMQIWEWLQSLGINMHRYTVNRLLTNKAYINQAVDKYGEHIEYPAILTEEEFYGTKHAQNIASGNKQSGVRRWRPCEQLIVCPVCGGKYERNSRSYHCHNHGYSVKRFTPSKYCDNTATLPVEYSDKLCVYVAKCCYLKDIRQSSKEQQRSLKNEMNENKKKIAVIEKSLASLNKKIKKIAAMYEDDVYTYDEYKERVSVVKKDAKDAENEKQRLESRNTSLLSDLNEFNIKTYTRTEQNALASKIFNEEMSSKELFDMAHKYIKAIRFKTVEGSKTKKILCFETTNYDNFYYMYQGNGRNFCVMTTSEILCKDFDHVTEYDLTEEFDIEKAVN